MALKKFRHEGRTSKSVEVQAETGQVDLDIPQVDGSGESPVKDTGVVSEEEAGKQLLERQRLFGGFDDVVFGDAELKDTENAGVKVAEVPTKEVETVEEGELFPAGNVFIVEVDEPDDNAEPLEDMEFLIGNENEQRLDTPPQDPQVSPVSPDLEGSDAGSETASEEQVDTPAQDPPVCPVDPNLGDSK